MPNGLLGRIGGEVARATSLVKLHQLDRADTVPVVSDAQATETPLPEGQMRMLLVQEIPPRRRGGSTSPSSHAAATALL